MTRALLFLIALAATLMLVPNRRRAELTAGRTLTRLEMAYDLPRLGDAREAVLSRLGTTLTSTWVGTALGMAVTAVGVWFFPDGSGAATMLLVLCAWLGGQVGRLVGDLRHASIGEVARRWQEWVPTSLRACLVVALVLAVATAGYLALALGQGLPALVLVGLAGSVLVVSTLGLRRALAASTFTPTPAPSAWTEALRGEAVRTATVLAPGATAGAVLFAVALAMPAVIGTSAAWVLVTLGAVAALVWVVSLVAGARSLHWHAARLGA